MTDSFRPSSITGCENFIADPPPRLPLFNCRSAIEGAKPLEKRQMILSTKQLSDDPRRAIALQLSAGTKNGNTVWLNSPPNLYLVEKQANAYLQLMARPYGSGFHACVRSLIAQHSGELLTGLGREIDLVDLGPGYPDKSFPLLAYMQRQNIAGCYMPVDISQKFLDVSAAACRPFGFPVVPHHMLFEELPEQLRKNRSPANRLIMMGITFMNYEPMRILPLLGDLGAAGNAVVLAGELYQPGKIGAMLEPYETHEAEAFNLLPLELAGLSQRSLRYFVRFQRSRIEMGFTLVSPIETTEFTIHTGCEIVTSLSYRYRPDELLSVLKPHFPRLELFCDDARTCAVVRASTPANFFSHRCTCRPVIPHLRAE